MTCTKAVWVSCVLMLGACAQAEYKTVEIKGQTFEIPQKYLDEGDVFFLPASQHDGAGFKVYPDDGDLSHVTVLLSPMKGQCDQKTVPVSMMLPDACAVAATGGKMATFSNLSELHKVYPHGYETQWEYRVIQSDSGQREKPIAMCTAPSSSRGGALCGIWRV